MISKFDSHLMLNLASAPASEPVSLAEAKTHMRIDHSDDDTYITALIPAARKRIEQVTRRALIDQTWEMHLNWFPDLIEVPRPPLSSVTSITYLDDNGASQTLASSVYTVDTDSQPGRIYEAYDQSWPTTYAVPKAIKVTFVAGYGSASSDVPADLVQAVKILVAHWYENREPVAVGLSVASIPMVLDYILEDYRIHTF
jgi:uncharacterized phiE125 gp8 family phage protein